MSADDIKPEGLAAETVTATETASLGVADIINRISGKLTDTWKAIREEFKVESWGDLLKDPKSFKAALGKYMTALKEAGSEALAEVGKLPIEKIPGAVADVASVIGANAKAVYHNIQTDAEDKLKALGEGPEADKIRDQIAESLKVLPKQLENFKKDIGKSIAKLVKDVKENPALKEALEKAQSSIGEYAQEIGKQFEAFGKTAEKLFTDAKHSGSKMLDQLLKHMGVRQFGFFEKMGMWVGEHKGLTAGGVVGAAAVAAIAFSGNNKNAEKQLDDKMSRQNQQDMAPARA